MKKSHQKAILQTPSAEYGGLIGGIAELLEAARRTAARTVNALMTATYWEIGRRIVEFEQHGTARAGYGEQILSKLSHDLTARFGRGFGVDNLQRFRSFFLSYPTESIHATLSRKLPVLPVRSQTPPRKSPFGKFESPITSAFPRLRFPSLNTQPSTIDSLSPELISAIFRASVFLIFTFFVPNLPF